MLCGIGVEWNEEGSLPFLAKPCPAKPCHACLILPAKPNVALQSLAKPRIA